MSQVSPHIFTPPPHNPNWGSNPGVGPVDFENEPPLLEELGINPEHIWKKTLFALNPFKSLDKELMTNNDTDMAGPLIFCFLLGIFLLLSGKIHFGYIYGVGTIGCLSMYLLLNLMSEEGIDVYQTVSILGYCLLPMVLLSFLSLSIPLVGVFGYTISAFFVLWCAYSASMMFVVALSLKEQRFLIAYPIFLLYACFGLFTIF